MGMGFGWTAASLLPGHRVSAAPGSYLGNSQGVVPTKTFAAGPGAQTFTPKQVPQMDISPQLGSILERILGPNYNALLNPSTVRGSLQTLDDNSNYLARGGNVPAVSTSATPRASAWGTPSFNAAQF